MSDRWDAEQSEFTIGRLAARFSAIRGSVERMQLQSMASLIIAGLFSRPAYSIPSYRPKARRAALGVLDP